MTPTDGKPNQVAVWYFVAATFIFAAPSLFFDDLPLWGRIGLWVLGLIVVAVGGWQLGRELKRPKPEQDRPPAR